MSATQERIVTIFGGSKCDESCEEYAQARRVGQLLAEAVSRSARVAIWA
jgi:predicted Rossmann-fold nucleotide-binding protein